MTNHRKTMLTLPEDAATELRRLEGEARKQYVVALRALGWTLQSLSEPLDVSRSRVGQIVDTTPMDPTVNAGLILPMPSPPVKEVMKSADGVERVTPDPDVVQQIKQLQPAAQSVRGSSTTGRTEAEEYTRLVWQEHQRGVSLYRLSKELSDEPDTYGTASHSALSSRLRRYGYKPVTTPNKSSSPILAKNRAGADLEGED